MRTFTPTSQVHLLLQSINSSSYASNPQMYLNPMNATACLQKMKSRLPAKTSAIHNKQTTMFPMSLNQSHEQQLVKLTSPEDIKNDDGIGSWLLLSGAMSIGFVLLLAALDDHKALAMGPGGPLMEEDFWDNVRRYALYALTVSTGALYTIFLPIFELLKNPISAILVLVLLGGGFYLVSQVVSAMVGVTDFTYYNDY